MAGSEEINSTESQSGDDSSSFVWDPQTRLYFHASSGFYHDPDAGWYYSSRDGLYYKFENGNYVLLEGAMTDKPVLNYQQEGAMADDPVLNHPCADVYDNVEEYNSSSQGQSNSVHAGDVAMNVADESSTAGRVDDNTIPELDNLPPPSQWLEDTLIDLYLSNYNLAANSAASVTTSFETEESENFKFPSDGRDETYELEEGEWIPEENHGFIGSTEAVPNEGDTLDEENWRAQYGQVTQSTENPLQEFPVVDLWDWVMVTRQRKDGKGQVPRLIGRLVKQSAKIHPSVPSGAGLLKTAPICEAHLDLVRVRTGQVYKLRSPSPRYLASLSTYDSSNPTKDWAFPDLSINKKASLQFKSTQKHKSEETGEKVLKDLSPGLPSASEKQKSHVYRDRAAERRTLHGGFGIGPGQKNAAVDHGSDPTFIEDAKAEALNMSFGAGSYARRILEGMGWKEGEALGSSTKGLTEPLQPTGNIGNAGLGWPQTRR